MILTDLYHYAVTLNNLGARLLGQRKGVPALQTMQSALDTMVACTHENDDENDKRVHKELISRACCHIHQARYDVASHSRIAVETTMGLVGLEDVDIEEFLSMTKAQCDGMCRVAFVLSAGLFPEIRNEELESCAILYNLATSRLVACQSNEDGMMSDLNAVKLFIMSFDLLVDNFYASPNVWDVSVDSVFALTVAVLRNLVYILNQSGLFSAADVYQLKLDELLHQLSRLTTLFTAAAPLLAAAAA